MDSRTAPRCQAGALDPGHAVVEGHAAHLHLARYIVQEALGGAPDGGDAAGPDVGGAHGAGAVGGQHHGRPTVRHGDGALGPGEGQRQGDQRQRVDHHGRVAAPAGAAAHHGGHRGRGGERGGRPAPAVVQQQVGARRPAAPRPAPAGTRARRSSRAAGQPLGPRGQAHANRAPVAPAPDGHAHRVAGLEPRRPRTTRRPGSRTGRPSMPTITSPAALRPAWSAGPPLVTSRTRAPPRGSAALVRPMNGPLDPLARLQPRQHAAHGVGRHGEADADAAAAPRRRWRSGSSRPPRARACPAAGRRSCRG